MPVARFSLLFALLPLAACASDATPTDPTETTWTGVLDEESFAALHELRADAAPELHGADIDLDGAQAYLSLPAGDGPHPAVVVIHEWWGLNDHIRHWADRLAADGYAALAVDLYGGEVATTPDRARELMMAVDAEASTATLRRAHAFLAEDQRVRASKRAVIGWCFGGGWSLNHAIDCGADLDAAVIYYGRLQTDPELLGKLRAPILGIFGEQDTGIPPSAVEAFEAAVQQSDVPAGYELRVSIFDAPHAFANPSSARYDQQSATAAWAQVQEFLAAKLKGGE